MYVQRVSVSSIAVAGTGSTATTTLSLPASFIPAAGCIYDIMLTAQVPAETDGTIIVIGTSNLYQMRNGNYARARSLGSRRILRVQFFDDPEHYNLIGVR